MTTGKYSKRCRSNVALIIVRIVFVSAFLFYCLLYNHSFPTNPNSVTNCFKLFSLFTTMKQDVCRKKESVTPIKVRKVSTISPPSSSSTISAPHKTPVRSIAPPKAKTVDCNRQKQILSLVNKYWKDGKSS